ncbi:MAG: hypothetical protein WBW99_21230, partial [Pseudolabrys sp.]
VKALEKQIVHRFQAAGRECISRGAAALARDNQSSGLESPWRANAVTESVPSFTLSRNAYDE